MCWPATTHGAEPTSACTHNVRSTNTSGAAQGEGLFAINAVFGGVHDVSACRECTAAPASRRPGPLPGRSKLVVGCKAGLQKRQQGVVLMVYMFVMGVWGGEGAPHCCRYGGTASPIVLRIFIN